MLPRALGRTAVAWIFLLAVGCTHGASKPAQSAGAPAAEPGKTELLVGPEATRDGEVVMAAWLAYGVSKAELYATHPPPRANRSADDFELELGARERQSAFWSEQRQKGVPAFALLDRQVDIWKAGFLRELILLVHAHPGWTVSSATIGSLRFEEFSKRFSGNYHSAAFVALKPSSGKLVPDVPGGDFPDPHGLPIAPATCNAAAGDRAAAWARWGVVEPELGGWPVAASDPLDFARQLVAVRSDPAFAGHAVTWVSPRVAHLAVLEGFCAVEARDWARAVAMMTRAAVLLPKEVMPRLELSLALNRLRRNDDALRQVDRAVTLASEGCVAAAAWRRRGFILFELGALEAARASYEKSLELEPNNPIALNELGMIAEEVRKGGSGDAGRRNPRSSYAPPPSNIVLTECRDGRTRPVGAP